MRGAASGLQLIISLPLPLLQLFTTTLQPAGQLAVPANWPSVDARAERYMALLCRETVMVGALCWPCALGLVGAWLLAVRCMCCCVHCCVGMVLCLLCCWVGCKWHLVSLLACCMHWLAPNDARCSMGCTAPHQFQP